MYVCLVKHQKSNKKFLFDCTTLHRKIFKGTKVLCDTVQGRVVGYVVSQPEYIGETSNNVVNEVGAHFPLKKIIHVIDKICLSDIKISKDFKNTIPDAFKLYECILYYKANHKLDKDIVLNKDNVLVDGYVRYLVAKMFDIKKVKYRREIR